MKRETPKWPVAGDKPWFTSGFWPDEVPKHPTFPVRSLAQNLTERAAQFPDRPALWFLETYVTYAQLKHYVDALATALHAQGVRKGDVVAIILPNSIQYLVSYYATVSLGAIATGVNPTYKPLEVLHQLSITKPKVLVVLDSLYETMVAPILKRTTVEQVISTNIADLATGISPLKRVLGKLLGKIPKGKVPGALKFTELLKTLPAVPDVPIDPVADPATYIMTGGTTGVPKAAVLTHYNALCNAIQGKLVLYDAVPGMAYLGVLPFFHSFAHTTAMNASIEFGAFTIIFPKPPEMHELVETVMRVGPKEGIIFPGVEVLFLRLGQYLQDHPAPGFAGKFRLCFSAAGPLHRHVKEMFEQASGARLVEAYGLTETGPGVSSGPLNGKDQPGKVGLPFPGTDWAIFDKDHFEQGPKPVFPRDPVVDDPPTEAELEAHAGEICVCGPQVMQGYLDQPEETAETLREWDGRTWLLTGDIGFMDATGQVIIRDRKKQLIKMKGYSIFPKEIEDLVARHPAVEEVAVAGLPDPETGEMVKAWVSLKPELVGTVTGDEIRAWCKENITHYKVPRQVEIIAEVPKSMVGKVMRRALQEADPLWRAD